MIEPTWEELVQREIDGENGPGDSARITQVMASHPDLRARYLEMQGAARALREMKEVEPPSGLTDDVLHAIRRQVASPPPGWLGTLRAAFGRQPALRYGFTFASGLAAAAVLVALAGQSPPLAGLDRSQLTGTILSDHRLDGLETVDRQLFALEGVRGEAVTKRGRDLVVAEVQIDSRRPIDVVVEFDGNVLSPLGFERSMGSGTDLVVDAGQVRVRHTGEGRYVLVLAVSERTPSPLRLKLTGEGLWFEKTLGTGPPATNLLGAGGVIESQGR